MPLSDKDQGGSSVTYERFEDLPVWKAAIELAGKAYSLTEKKHFRGKYSLRDQIERAALSVSNNIAEGFERGTTQELLTFLYIARGSAGEVRSMLIFIESIPGFDDLKSQISDLRSLAESVSRQLRAWADSLQNSDIRGHRYLTDRERRIRHEEKERAEFLDMLKSYTRKGPPEGQ
jgi:four helix bundle protein